MPPAKDDADAFSDAATTRIGFLLVAYLLAYLALDWASLIQPYGTLGISPWNPPAGLSFALLLKYGSAFGPPLFVAVVLADTLFRGLSSAPVATLSSAFLIAVIYALAAELLRLQCAVSVRLDSHRDLLLLFAVMIGAAAAAAGAVVGVFAVAGLLEWSEFFDAALHFWTGDVIGIAVVTPFLLLLLDPHGTPRRTARDYVEHALQLATIAAGLWVIFGIESVDHFEFSYVLFLPLVWIALRDGLAGATWGIVATQLGLVAAILLKDVDTGVMAQFQLLMLAVALTGLLLGSIVDERRRAEASLRDSEAQLQTVVSTAPDAIVTYDEDGRILTANRAASVMFGIAEPQGRAMADLLPEIDGALRLAETVARRPDGTTFVADAAIGEARVRSDRIFVAVIRDVTERKQAEMSLKQHEAELAHASRVAATGEMAAALAHELNQPLLAAVGFARACETVLGSESGTPEERRRTAAALIERTVEQALRAGEIIRSTREFLNRADPRHARFEVRQIVDTVLDLVGPEASQKAVRVTVDLSPGVPAVFVDPIQIEQVLLNLARNSIEAMVRAGTEGRGLAISAALSANEPGFVEFGVRDNGPGFAPEIAERLFTPFTTTKDTGMGLGLSIGRTLVEAHGGRIFVVPSTGGAEIRFTVPVYNQMATDA